jgi:predicted protein tyrosine phosphatase
MLKPSISVPLSNSYWVVPGQLLAGEHPIDISDEATMTRLASLLDSGVRTIVDLTEEREKIPSYSGLLNSIAIDRHIDVTIHRIPIPDRDVPSARTLVSILDVIDRSMANKNPVYVHCFAGIGRTGTIVGCYLMRHGRAKSQNVIAKISALRSQMPCGSDASPHTSEQITAVMNWREGF